MRQLHLLSKSHVDDTSPLSPETLAEALCVHMGRPVRVAFTDNRSTMVSSTERGGKCSVRLHAMFRHAGPTQIAALADYLRGGDRAAGKMIDDFIRAHSHNIRTRHPRMRPHGRFHQLDDVFALVNARYFHNACTALITWGSAGSRHFRRSIQLGSYVRDLNVIRIHPCLDQSFVPGFYVRWVVFHEMLHEAFGSEEVGGRRVYHPPAFCALEEGHPDYHRVRRWEDENLERLLRYRPLKENPRHRC